MEFLSATVGISQLLIRAYEIYTACKAAPTEIQLATDHLHTLTVVLQGVETDILKNKTSFLRQSGANAETKRRTLASNLKLCEKSLVRMERVLKTYNGLLKNGGVKAWDRYRWSNEGKQEIADAKADLVLATSSLDIWMNAQNLGVLWKIEAMMEIMMKKFAMLDMFAEQEQQRRQGGRTSEGTRLRSGSNVARALWVSLVICRLRKVVLRYRRKLAARKKQNGNNGARRHTKPVVRMNSGFGIDRDGKRDVLLCEYANRIAEQSRAGETKRKTARTPSPDFYMMGEKRGNAGGFFPQQPVRRSSSMQRIMGRINARTVTPRAQQPREKFECWKVGTGETAFGFRAGPMVQVQHKRGQAQLKKMAEVFGEAAVYDRFAVTERDERVKGMLKEKNRMEAKNGSGKRWYFVAGRVVKRDPGRTGLVVVEKVILVLVRR